MIKSLFLLFVCFTLNCSHVFCQNTNEKSSIETNVLTVFTFNYQKGKYDKGVIKNKMFTFDLVKNGNNMIVKRSEGNKKKKQATIGVKKVNNDADDHNTYYSSEYKTTICIQDNNVIIHFAEHMDRPSEIRVYSIGPDANELIHPTITASK